MRNAESFEALLRSIHSCKALSVIELTIEQNLQDRKLSPEQRADLTTLQGMNSLDHIRIFTGTKLGLDEEVAQIKAFLERKKNRPKPNLDDLLVE